MSLRNLKIIVLVAGLSLFCYWTHQRTRHAMVVGDALELIDNHYVEPVESRELILNALKGLTGGLDPNSEFVPLEQYQQLQDAMTQEFAGIGIYIIPAPDDLGVQVRTPLVGSPAMRAGMLGGDIFTKINNEDVVGMSLKEVTERLKGPVGSVVQVAVLRGDETIELEITRDRIQIDSVIGDHRNEDNQWVYRLNHHPRIGYARLTTFGEKTPTELRQVLQQCDDVDGFILDLRHNGGGLLETAVAVCDLFLAGGKVVSTRIRGGVIDSERLASPDTVLNPKVPMAVLVDHQSASASEIVAAALQDQKRATIIGTRTFGKGTVQNVIPLEVGRSALKLTVAKYIRPSGENIHRDEKATEEDTWGVMPTETDTIELEDSQWIELFRAWSRASYPYAAKLPEDLVPEESETEWTDPHIQRAIEILVPQPVDAS